MHKSRFSQYFLMCILLIVVTVVLVISSASQVFSTAPSQVYVQVIESDDRRVSEVGSWTSQNATQASGGSYLYSSGSGDDTLTVQFYGTTVEVVYVEHPSFGAFTVEIDGGAKRTVFSQGVTTVFDKRAIFDYLEPEMHTLRIVGVQDTVAIDAFVVSSAVIIPSSTPPVVLENVITTPAPLVSMAESMSAQSTPSDCAGYVVVAFTNELRDEIEKANNDQVGGNYPYCIYLEAGEYPIDQTLHVTSNIRLYGRGADNTTISTVYSIPILEIDFAPAFEIHHVNIENGFFAQYGGGVINHQSDVKIFDSRFTDNQAINGGGAIMNGVGTVEIHRTTFVNNVAGGGGAIQNQQGSLVVHNSCFLDNNAGYGGAILDVPGLAIATINGSLFDGNRFTDLNNGGGGAIYNVSSAGAVYTYAGHNQWVGSPPNIDGTLTPHTATPETYTDTVSERVDVNPVVASVNCTPEEAYPLPEPYCDTFCELLEYGIVADPSGIPPGTLWANDLLARPWDAGEPEEVLAAAERTAWAFMLLKGIDDDSEGKSDAAKSLFAEVLGEDNPPAPPPPNDTITHDYFYVLRVEVNFDIQDAGCPPSPIERGCTSPGLRAIALYGANWELGPGNHTVIHEFGHLFDDESSIPKPGGGIDNLSDRVDGVGPVVEDCVNARVMGRHGSDPNWVRGSRGWGSGSGKSIFQQNVDGTPETDEAAADMFLNWVYRITTDAIPSDWSGDACTDSAHQVEGDTTGETWQGFLNRSWFGDDNGSRDTTWSGNKRYFWMNDQMADFFSIKGW